jgi:phosphatidylinositol alpha 1,6-mannosyltransferase
MSQPLRVAVVTESFLPSLNGVTTSVCQILQHLQGRGDQAMVICPGPAPQTYAGYPVVTVPAVSYRQFPVGLPTPTVQRALERFSPDLVHAASPFVLGASGLATARRLGLPSVAVYQTDVAGYARRHRAAPAASTAWRWLRRVHAAADLTLAPSLSALVDLAAHGITRTALWGRGVDLARFHPVRRASPEVATLRAQLAPDCAVLVGYVGRLAPEKRVERLAAVADVGGIRLVIVGDGPSRPSVARALPGATLTGRLEGDALADAYAALDLFVHTGTEETFGQTLQEAMATGLPVVAPAAGGPLDLIEPGVQGFLYPPEDDLGLRNAVRELAGNAGLRQRLGEAGRCSVLPRSWSVLGEQLIQHYRLVLSRTDAAKPEPTGRAA